MRGVIRVIWSYHSYIDQIGHNNESFNHFFTFANFFFFCMFFLSLIKNVKKRYTKSVTHIGSCLHGSLWFCAVLCSFISSHGYLLRIPLSNSIVSLGFSMAAFRKNSFRLFLELRHMAIFIVIGDGLSFISIYMWYTWDLQAFVFWCSIGVTDLGKFDLSWTKWALCRSSYKKSFDPQGRKKPP